MVAVKRNTAAIAASTPFPAKDGERERLSQILAGAFQFDPGMRVSKRSSYGESQWDFTDSNNPRLLVHTSSKLRLQWSLLQRKFGLPDGVIEDLKRHAFLRLTYSTELFHGNSNPTITSVVSETRLVIRLLAKLCTNLRVGDVCLIGSLADIRVSDLRVAMANCPPGSFNDIKRVLRHLAHALVGKALTSGPPQWTVPDINSLEQAVPHNKQRHDRLPDGMFRLLSNAATRDVKHFLVALGCVPVDTSRLGEQDAAENVYLQTVPAFANVFARYELHHAGVRGSYRPRNKQAWHSHYDSDRTAETRRWRLDGYPSLRQFTGLISRARMAAQILVSMYTGARESELRLFRLDCLTPPTEPGSVWVLRGTVIKDRPIDAPVDRDGWAVPPIVRDAFAVLRRTAAIVGSSYVFHREANRPDQPVAYLFPCHVLNRYLKLIDPDAAWKTTPQNQSEVKALYPHMLKNSLAFELRRVDCGIPAITVQLQHKSYLDRRINPVTVAYGQLDRDASSKAAKDANLAYAHELFHPDARRVGGGALEFGVRLRAKFTGYAEAGLNETEVLQHFVQDGLPPLADVGLGYCLGRRKVIVDGREVDPPCVGSLRCNPVDCTNGIIPENKRPIWIKLAKENRARSQDPELFYLKDTCEAIAALAERVIREFEEK